MAENGSEAHAIILKNCVAQCAILLGANLCNSYAAYYKSLLEKDGGEKMGVDNRIEEQLRRLEQKFTISLKFVYQYLSGKITREDLRDRLEKLIEEIENP